LLAVGSSAADLFLENPLAIGCLEFSHLGGQGLAVGAYTGIPKLSHIDLDFRT
jgi:hypothetical protein